MADATTLCTQLDLVKSICDAIGLDATLVTKIVITLDANEPLAMIEIDTIASVDLMAVDWSKLKDANITVNEPYRHHHTNLNA